jgi:hypothetical protein
MPVSPTLRLVLAGLLAPALIPVSTASAAEPPAPDPLVTNVEGRRSTSLDGRWRTIVDAFERGYYDYRTGTGESRGRGAA